MSILARIYEHTLGRVLPRSSSYVDQHPASKKRKHGESDGNESSIRHQRYEEENSIITKRRRVNEDTFAPIVNGEEYESTLIAAPSTPATTMNDTNKILLPPPAIVGSTAYDHGVDTNSTRESMEVDSASHVSHNTQVSPNKPINETSYDHDMERARRHAAATTLPENSGIWEESEKNLFFHISYRGFEPLLPQTWMPDFRTLPLSLYAAGDDEVPLIRALRPNTEFRAIRELRELLDLGRKVRDRVLAKPGSKREDIIDRAVRKYIKWALWDAGIKKNHAATRRESMPVHVQIKTKFDPDFTPKENTVRCIAELKVKMHALKAQHLRTRNIHESIERDFDDVPTPGSEGVTRIAESSDDDLPVIYGIMITRSILAIFTMNSRVRFPRIRDERARLLASSGAEANDFEDESASDPRFISNFDFSDHKKDVWNAFVIAILAMQIRNDMLAIRDSNADELEDLCAGIEESSVIDDDPDA